MTNGQQPVWGVGRLRLSVTGIAEPQNDKCNDSRLFCIHTKNWRNSLRFSRADSIGVMMEAVMA
jgi:hypothetical protein